MTVHAPFDLSQLDFAEIARKERARNRTSPWIVVLTVLLALLWVAPFYYLMVSIFKSPEEYAGSSPFALPEGITPVWANIVDAWTTANMAQGFANSALYGIVGASLAVFIAALAAHGLARFQFNGKTFWFMLIFAGTVFPFQMYLIPLFFTYQQMGIINTKFGMILFYAAVCIPFPVLVLRNYMSQISTEMDEAARMDGCSEFRLFLSIVLPNCWSPMAALFLLQFTWIWNDLLFSTVLSQSTDVRSIMSALQVFQGGYASTSPVVVLTASLIASLPTVVLFLALRKTFLRGISISSG
jgi:ABC-type glycerol-3-phosphate transport system permease component